MNFSRRRGYSNHASENSNAAIVRVRRDVAGSVLVHDRAADLDARRECRVTASVVEITSRQLEMQPVAVSVQRVRWD
jgi:hypothetical protein